jgi:hypothetical protein
MVLNPMKKPTLSFVGLGAIVLVNLMCGCSGNEGKAIVPDEPEPLNCLDSMAIATYSLSTRVGQNFDEAFRIDTLYYGRLDFGCSHDSLLLTAFNRRSVRVRMDSMAVQQKRSTDDFPNVMLSGMMVRASDLNMDGLLFAYCDSLVFLVDTFRVLPTPVRSPRLQGGDFSVESQCQLLGELRAAYGSTPRDHRTINELIHDLVVHTRIESAADKGTEGYSYRHDSTFFQDLRAWTDKMGCGSWAKVPGECAR